MQEIPNPRSVFIVDDDKVFTDLAKEMFTQIASEIEVKSFLNGPEMLASLSNEKKVPNLILLDINMPGLSGVDILKVIREKDKHRDIPIIILSSSNDKMLIDDCYSNDASSFIPKPNNPSGLIEVVETISLIVRYLDNRTKSPKN